VDPLIRLIEQSDAFGNAGSVESTLLSLLLSFVLGQLIAWVYTWTHSGLSYARTFTQSLVLITMVVALVLHIIGNSIITAFGLLGALAIIRFRNVLKDTRDTAFVLLSLVVGMAVGAQRYDVAIVGALTLLLVTGYLHTTRFGSRGHYDGHLTCWLALDGEADAGYASVLERFCRRVREVSIRRSGGDTESAEYTYQIRLRDRSRHAEFVAALRGLSPVDDVALVLRDELAEV